MRPATPSISTKWKKKNSWPPILARIQHGDQKLHGCARTQPFSILAQHINFRKWSNDWPQAVFSTRNCGRTTGISALRVTVIVACSIDASDSRNGHAEW